MRAATPRDLRAVWLTEPDEKAWNDEATGYQCLALRGPTGAWCGYVRVPDEHPARGAHYGVNSIDLDEFEAWSAERVALQRRINDIRVHGGLTYAGAQGVGGWWFGFDCAHAGDYSPKYDQIDHPVLGLGRPTGWGEVHTYRTLAYVEEECAALARQLSEITEA